MRKLGKQYIQSGTGKTTRKKPAELITDLTTTKGVRKTDKKTGQLTYKKTKGTLTKKQLAKELGISDRSLRAYKNYFASLANPNIKLGKNDRKPSKNKIKSIEKKIKALSKKQNIKLTRKAGSVFDRTEIETFKNVISKSLWNQVKDEIKKPTFFGWLIRINISFITKQGTFDDWLTYATSITNYNDLDEFLSDQIYKKVTKKNSILGFEIIEVIINVTTKEYEPNKPKSKKSKAPLRNNPKSKSKKTGKRSKK